MPAANTLNFQDFTTPQSNLQPKPVTLASAATIAPVTPLTVVTGTTQIVTITPPFDGFHVLWFLPTGALPAFSVAGNVLNAGAVSTANVPFEAIYNPITGKYSILGKA
jgi:hypothetical protein